MRDALAASGRDIVLSICEWGTDKPWEWGPAMDSPGGCDPDYRAFIARMRFSPDLHPSLSKFR